MKIDVFEGGNRLAITRGWKDDLELLDLFQTIAINDPFERQNQHQDNPRQTALAFLLRQYPAHSSVLALLQDRVQNDPDPQLRKWARGRV